MAGGGLTLRPCRSGWWPSYKSNVNLNVKVLDSVKCGGPKWTRTLIGLVRVQLGPPDLIKSRTFTILFALAL